MFYLLYYTESMDYKKATVKLNQQIILLIKKVKYQSSNIKTIKKRFNRLIFFITNQKVVTFVV